MYYTITITVDDTELATTKKQQLFMADLLYGVWYIRVNESEQQVPEGPTLSTQHCGPGSPCVGQRQVDGQQFHAQQHKLVMFPGKETKRERVRSLKMRSLK